MSPEEKKEAEPGAPPPAGTPPAETPPGGAPDKSLENAEKPVLLKVIEDLRAENATHRTKAKAAEESLDQVSKRLKGLEDAAKTNEQKETERLAALEAEAKKVPALERYQEHAAAELKDEMKRVEGLKAEQKKPYLELLGGYAENDYLGRLKAIRAIKAAEGVRSRPGDEGSPGEPGGGKAGVTLAQQLSWSPSGMDEARIAGRIPKE